MATTPTTSPATPLATSPAATSKEPAATFRFGALSAAVFPVEVTNKAGAKATLYNLSLRKAYRNADGEWDHTPTIGGDDALTAAFLYTRCAQYIADARKGSSAE